MFRQRYQRVVLIPKLDLLNLSDQLLAAVAQRRALLVHLDATYRPTNVLRYFMNRLQSPFLGERVLYVAKGNPRYLVENAGFVVNYFRFDLRFEVRYPCLYLAIFQQTRALTMSGSLRISGPYRGLRGVEVLDILLGEAFAAVFHAGALLGERESFGSAVSCAAGGEEQAVEGGQ